MHIKANGTEIITFPYRMSDLRAENPNVSFPRGYEAMESLLADFGVYPVVQGEKPTYDEQTHALRQSDTPELVEGVWTLGWITEDLPVEVQTANDQRAIEFARTERDRFLRETDWMALSDQTLTPEWAAYRQALREVPQQPGFPHDIQWPTEPQ